MFGVLMGFVWHMSRRSKSGMITTFILSFISHATAIVALLIPLAMIVRKNKYIPIAIVVASLPLAFLGSSALIAALSSHLGALGDRPWAMPMPILARTGYSDPVEPEEYRLRLYLQLHVAER